VRKSVTVVSSDAQQANYPLQFSAVVGGVPPTVGLLPEGGIDFDRFASDEHREAKIAITNFSPEAVNISIVGPPPEFLEAHLSVARLEPKQSADLVVKTKNAAPLGKFSGAVTVVLAGTQSTRLTIPISGVSMMK
jgi:hypothetical protein